jgi:hypothetical protein
MSADNWTFCPKCTKEREAIFANMERQVADSYGKVPVEEFDANRANLEAARLSLNTDVHRTWREDYTFEGASEGVVNVHYRGGCTKCKLKLEFSEDHPIPGA